jgi:hypothetical protein
VSLAEVITTQEMVLAEKKKGISLDGIAISVRIIFYFKNKKYQNPSFCEVSLTWLMPCVSL